MSAAPPTLAACLTPPGRGAIATIAVRGPRAWDIARALFQPISDGGNPLPEQPPSGRFWFGRFGRELADEVVLAAPRIAPIPRVEVHCHGGPEVVRLILEAFSAEGVEVCTWQALEQQPAIAELVNAPTARTAAILLDQIHGAFAAALQAVIAALDTGDTTQARSLLQSLAAHAPLGRHLTAPWRVAVLGAPNVGKSSLVNALAGFPRCVVSATPGTTRDAATTLIAVEGWPVELIDTAGLRADATDLEAEGIGQARAVAAAADLCLWVHDASTQPTWPDVAGLPVRSVINKTDLPAAWDIGQVSGTVSVSARTGAGLPELCQQLAFWLVPQPPPPGTAVPFTPPLCDSVEQAYRTLTAGQADEARRLLQMMQAGLPGK